MQDKVKHLIEEAIAENPDLFLVDWKISPSNQIEVLVDGDSGLPIDEVVRISRHIEHNLDREEFDFALTVSSPGVSRPLETERQFRKNIGRKLKVKMVEESIKATLSEVNDTGIELKWKAREPKPIGKGKHTVEKNKFIPFVEIKEAKIIVDI